MQFNKKIKKNVCRICNNDINNKLFRMKEITKGVNKNFEYFECSKCGCLQIKNFPSNINDYYLNDYYSFSKNKFNIANNFFIKIIINYILNFVIFKKGIINKYVFNKILSNFTNLLGLQSLSEISDITKKHKILDVGCGNGGKLYLLKNFGFVNLLGIDPFIDTDIYYNNGLSILKKDINDIDEKWDIIIFNHSFEHMKNPKKVLCKVYKILKKNGICIIRIPTTSSYAWKYYQENWIQIDAPRHFYLHSIGSIKILAKKTGFILDKYIYDSHSFQFWGSEQISKNISLLSKKSYLINKKLSIFNKRQIKNYNNESHRLNKKKLGDQAAFFLKKQ